MNNSENIKKAVYGGLTASLIFVATCISIPNGMGGYTHLGDAFAVVTVMLLGWRQGAVSACIGAMLSDIILGYAMWAPFTIFAKLIMTAIMGTLIESGIFGENSRARWFTAVISACAAETLVYCASAYVLEGGVGGAAAEAVSMLVQSALAVIVGFAVTEALQRTRIKRIMRYTT